MKKQNEYRVLATFGRKFNRRQHYLCVPFSAANDAEAERRIRRRLPDFRRTELRLERITVVPPPRKARP